MINRLRENFTQVDNRIINNDTLSLKAKWLYAFLCSKHDNWNFSYNWLCSQLKEWEKAIRWAVEELVNAFVLLRIPLKWNNNLYNGWDWIINPTEEDLKNNNDPFRNLPKSELAKMGTSENGHLLSNNKINNTKLSNINIFNEFLENDNNKNTWLYILLKTFFELWYKPSKSETIEWLRDWTKKVIELNKITSLEEFKNICLNFELYWKWNWKEIKNLKTTFLNNPNLISNKKKNEK